MLRTSEGVVISYIVDREDIQELVVRMESGEAKAMNYPVMTGRVSIGDWVILNTTAVDLSLGTGGYHFVLHGPKRPQGKLAPDHHLMKLRYTPLQMATGSCEEQESPYHEIMKNKQSLESMPVLVGELHSMLPILVTLIKEVQKEARIVYIMTDKGALPISFSKHVRELKQLNWLHGTITTGHAFGGDLEALNIYTGLLAAKHILQADIAIVTMGPGIAGTGTPLGFTGMEQTEVLHAVHSLQGIPIFVPRVGAGDARSRHQGISHHTYSVLEHTLIPVHISFLEQYRDETNRPPFTQHHCYFTRKDELPKLEPLLDQYPFPIGTMGRTIKEDPLFFYSVAAAGVFACAPSDATNR